MPNVARDGPPRARDLAADAARARFPRDPSLRVRSGFADARWIRAGSAARAELRVRERVSRGTARSVASSGTARAPWPRVGERAEARREPTGVNET
jgi:hypothetical protein